jgi:hypothetical protein
MKTDAPAVTCLGCGFAWHSSTLADGLRLLGSCPRCAGTLTFASPADDTPQAPPSPDPRPPHMVLGFPRN